MSPSRAGLSCSLSWRIVSSTWLVTFFLHLENSFSARKSENWYFLPTQFVFLFFSEDLALFYSFLCSVFSSKYDWFSGSENAKARKTSFELKKTIHEKKIDCLVLAQKLKCPAWLDSAWKLFSSDWLRSGNFSSNSSLLFRSSSFF